MRFGLSSAIIVADGEHELRGVASELVLYCYNGDMHAARQARLQKALDHIVETLVREYEPEKIIVFGSFAAGEVHEWSDLDLVILKDTDVPFIERGVEVALLCRAGLGVDYLVYTPAEFAQMIADDNIFIVDEVLGKGKIVYERESTPVVA